MTFQYAFHFQLVAKSLLMRYTQQMTSVINRIIAVYEANAKTKSRKRAMLLQNMAWLSEMLLVGGLVAYMNCAALHFLNPIYGYFWQNEFKALFPLYIPFIDETTAIGFTILMTIQSFEIFIALLSSACADFAFMIKVINVWIFSTIFHGTVHELNDILRKEKARMPLVRTKLRRICKMYYDVWMWVV